MIPKNSSSCPVQIKTNEISKTLSPQESFCIENTGIVELHLSHVYSSKALADDELLHQMRDVRTESLLSPSAPPFYLAMDTIYTIPSMQNKTVEIVRETLRASVNCVYDRLAIRTHTSNTQNPQHIIKERNEYISKYIAALRKNNHFLIKLAFFLTIPLCSIILALGIIGTITVDHSPIFLAFCWVGLISACLILLSPAIIMYICNRIWISRGIKDFEKDFENKIIIERFAKAIAEADDTYIID